MQLNKQTKLRLLGGLLLVFNLWLIGRYSLQGIFVLLLTFGFAAGYEYLVVRPFSAMNNENPIKLNKGWSRLLIIISIVWVAYISAITTIEYNSINVFEQFEPNPPNYTFWQWAEQNPEGDNVPVIAVELKYDVFTTVLFLPLAIVWFLAWAIAWVKNGFSIEN